MSGTPGPKRSKSQLEEDRRFISEKFVQSYTLKEITSMLNDRNRDKKYTLTFQQVHYDIKLILQGWYEERTDLIDNYIELEIKKLNKIEQECWEAWEASKVSKSKSKINDAVIDQQGNIRGGRVSERQIEESHGDPRYLDMIQTCIDKRLKLLGLYKQTIRVEGDIDFTTASKMSDEELDDEINRLIKSSDVYRNERKN